MQNSPSINHVWFNGKFFPKNEIKIDILTHGLHYGTGAFEGIRFYNGKIFKLEEHIVRLFNSAKILLMDIPFSFENITQACLEIIKLNNLKDGYIRPLIFLDNQSTAIGAENKVNVMITCWGRTTPYFSDIKDKKSLRLNISSIIKPSPKSIPYEVKASGLYIINHLAKKRSFNEGYDDCLMLDYRGYIAEATTSNFFMIKNNILYTPIPECCLNGVTRQVIIEIAQNNNVKVIEKYILPEELSDAEEAFLTGTACEIHPISSINQYEFKDNPITQMIYSKFYKLTQE